MRDTKLHTALEANGYAILNYFERRVGRDDAPDLLADVMLVAWRRIHVMPDNAQDTRMWLFGVARNVLLEHDRAERRRTRLAGRLRAATRVSPLQSPPADQHAEVLDAVRRLPSDLRELVQLVHWDGFTLAAAADHIGIGASTARSRYQRAREILRAALLPESVAARRPADSALPTRNTSEEHSR